MRIVITCGKGIMGRTLQQVLQEHELGAILPIGTSRMPLVL